MENYNSKAVTTGHIEFHKAAALITNFLNEGSLKQLSDSSIGGVFHTDPFKLQTGELGAQFWLCFNSPEEKNPEKHPLFFVAVEKRKKAWGRRTSPTKPETKILSRPTDPITYNGNTSGTVLQDEVEAFLIKNSFPKTPPAPIKSELVEKYSNSFKTLFGQISGKHYCKYPIAYFVDKDDDEHGKPHHYFKELIEQTGKQLPKVHHVACFIGLETDITYNPNLIRLILFPLDEDGKIIFGREKDGKLVTSVILQKSFPPPPYS